MCFKQDGVINTLNDKPLKLVDLFTYLGSNISSERVQLYGCTARTSTKHLEIKARCQLHKDAAYFFQQILETAPNKAAAVQPLVAHLTNHPLKLNKTSSRRDKISSGLQHMDTPVYTD